MTNISSPPVRFSRRYWLRLALFTITLATVAFLALLIYFVNRQVEVFVTPVRNTALALPPELALPTEEITLTTEDSLALSGWYVPGHRPQAIILVHGINANRMALLPQALILHEVGYHVLLFDLRGHGLSQGTTVTYGYREAWDVQAAADYLARLPAVERIGVMGTSLGGAAVVRAAALDPRLEAVVIESSYSSLPAAVEDAFDDFSAFPEWPFAPLLVDLAERRAGVEIGQVDSARDLATIAPRPVLIIHGANDQLFPPAHAQRLYDAAHEPKSLWLIEDVAHGIPQSQVYQERLLAFFETALGTSR